MALIILKWRDREIERNIRVAGKVGLGWLSTLGMYGNTKD